MLVGFVHYKHNTGYLKEEIGLGKKEKQLRKMAVTVALAGMFQDKHHLPGFPRGQTMSLQILLLKGEGEHTPERMLGENWSTGLEVARGRECCSSQKESTDIEDSLGRKMPSWRREFIRDSKASLAH